MLRSTLKLDEGPEVVDMGLVGVGGFGVVHSVDDPWFVMISINDLDAQYEQRQGIRLGFLGNLNGSALPGNSLSCMVPRGAPMSTMRFAQPENFVSANTQTSSKSSILGSSVSVTLFFSSTWSSVLSLLANISQEWRFQN
jgi:hypothetical protein